MFIRLYLSRLVKIFFLKLWNVRQYFIKFVHSLHTTKFTLALSFIYYVVRHPSLTHKHLTITINNLKLVHWSSGAGLVTHNHPLFKIVIHQGIKNVSNIYKNPVTPDFVVALYWNGTSKNDVAGSRGGGGGKKFMLASSDSLCALCFLGSAISKVTIIFALHHLLNQIFTKADS